MALRRQDNGPYTESGTDPAVVDALPVLIGPDGAAYVHADCHSETIRFELKTSDADFKAYCSIRTQDGSDILDPPVSTNDTDFLTYHEIIVGSVPSRQMVGERIDRYIYLIIWSEGGGATASIQNIKQYARDAIIIPTRVYPSWVI